MRKLKELLNSLDLRTSIVSVIEKTLIVKQAILFKRGKLTTFINFKEKVLREANACSVNRNLVNIKNSLTFYELDSSADKFRREIFTDNIVYKNLSCLRSKSTWKKNRASNGE